jgi:hypothetical protein
LQAKAYSGSNVLAERVEGYTVRFGNTLDHLSTNTSAATATALQRILAKIRSEQQFLNSAAVVAEGLDVIRQFGAPASALCDLLNRYLNRLYLESRGLKGSTAFRKVQWLKIVAATWLEYSFGLAPLISDSVKAAEALAHWQGEQDYEFRNRSRVVGRGTSESVSQTAPTGTSVYTSGKLVYSGTDRKETKYKVQYVCGLRASHKADIGSNERLLQLLGWKPENWVPALWEVIPNSWLLDYFSNVGQILEAGVTSTADVTWTCKTVSQETVRTYMTPISVPMTRAQLAAYNWGLQSAGGHAGQWSQRRTTVTRDADAVLGCPPLVLTVPTEWKKLANMAAAVINRGRTTSALWLT